MNIRIFTWSSGDILYLLDTDLILSVQLLPPEVLCPAWKYKTNGDWKNICTGFLYTHALVLFRWYFDMWIPFVQHKAPEIPHRQNNLKISFCLYHWRRAETATELPKYQARRQNNDSHFPLQNLTFQGSIKQNPLAKSKYLNKKISQIKGFSSFFFLLLWCMWQQFLFKFELKHPCYIWSTNHVICWVITHWV